MRVLLVEDDPGIVQGLCSNLAVLGWALDVADGIAPAWAALRAEPFDVVLLDLGLADGDGTELLRRVRTSAPDRLPDPRTPVLIMTARDQVSCRIEGLDAGADDYVSKPFDVDELAARMRALRRRVVGRADGVVVHGQLLLDPSALTTTLAGRAVDLSTREFAVLLALVEASPKVLSRPQLEAKLYNWDRALDSNAIEVHIHHVRKKLGENLIRTVRGVGYFVPAAAA
ncbi:MAG: DNA-binding response regulator [Ramlibacter sp.]|uniref:response regulator n=1 Tax=Ramlibacter sp. TaxID=1917967 RepID=UPI00261D6AB8|nr:response regulator transcription factor [Ramlibacter sp.]MDB5753103.1 DNA-binding response regulator [Ramlibacter sp.]